jgi:phosphoribosylanthranilate isomerase
MALCKMCGFKEPETAHFAAQSGASYIGIVFHEESPRYVTGAQAIEVVLAAKEGGAIPVAVFTTHGAGEMLQIANDHNIDTIQLHGDKSRKEHTILPDTFTRLFAIPVSLQGEYKNPPLDKILPKRDFLLYDGPVPGTGTKFSWGKFTPIPKHPFALAGGLTPTNVKSAIQILAPHIVDVSSGIETHGKKDHDLIARFLEEARGE